MKIWDKKLVSSLMVLTMFIFCMSLTSAFAVSITTPSASGTTTGSSAIINVTATATTTDWNCTIYAKSTLTANSSWSTLLDGSTIANATSIYWNATIDTTTLEDANNYIFNATCVNGATSAEDTNTGITVDNFAPDTPTLSPADLTTKTTSGTQTFTGTVNDSETTSCTYTIYRANSPSDGTSGSGTYSGASCTFTKAFSVTSDNGVWWWDITASDETNTTTSGKNKLNVNLPGSGGGALIGQGPLSTATEGKVSIGWKWFIAILLILSIIGMIIYFSGK